MGQLLFLKILEIFVMCLLLVSGFNKKLWNIYLSCLFCFVAKCGIKCTKKFNALYQTFCCGSAANLAQLSPWSEK